MTNNKSIHGTRLLLLSGIILLGVSFIQAQQSTQDVHLKKGLEKARIEKVIDGDTVVLTDGRKVRLIGIDTPELNNPSKPVEYYAEEAKRFTEEQCEGKLVTLEYGNLRKDRHNRTLAYIYLPSGEMLNERLVSEGYAVVYTQFPFKYIEHFRGLEQKAREEEKGFWGTYLGNSDVRNLVHDYMLLDGKGRVLLRRYLANLLGSHARKLED